RPRSALRRSGFEHARLFVEVRDARVSWLAWLVLWILVCFAAGVLEADRGVAVVGRFAWLGGSTSLSAVMLAGLGTRTMRCGAKACGATQGRETGCVVGARRPRAAGT